MKPNTHQAHNRQRRPRRSANNNNRRHHNNHANPNKHWESMGPNVRIRGSAHQIYDKYVTLAADAKRNGDRVLVENLMQHAEHYARIMNRQQAQQAQRQAQKQAQQTEQDNLDQDNEAIEDSAQQQDKKSSRRKRPMQDQPLVNAENEAMILEDDQSDDDQSIDELSDADDSSDSDDDDAIVEDLTPRPALPNTEADDIE